jgi:hypothetical protein
VHSLPAWFRTAWFDRGSLLATYRKPFDMLVEGNENGNWLGVMDGIRNWLLTAA